MSKGDDPEESRSYATLQLKHRRDARQQTHGTCLCVSDAFAVHEYRNGECFKRRTSVVPAPTKQKARVCWWAYSHVWGAVVCRRHFNVQLCSVSWLVSWVCGTEELHAHTHRDSHNRSQETVPNQKTEGLTNARSMWLAGDERRNCWNHSCSWQRSQQQSWTFWFLLLFSIFFHSCLKVSKWSELNFGKTNLTKWSSDTCSLDD